MEFIKDNEAIKKCLAAPITRHPLQDGDPIHAKPEKLAMQMQTQYRNFTLHPIVSGEFTSYWDFECLEIYIREQIPTVSEI